MRTPFGLFIIALSSTVFFGCARKQAQDISLTVPKGYSKATKIVSGSWEDQLKQKLALGDAAQAELTRIPYLSAQNPVLPKNLPKNLIVQAAHPAQKTGNHWFSPLVKSGASAVSSATSALTHLLPGSAKTNSPTAATKKAPVRLAKAQRQHRAISCKNCRARKGTHLIAGR